MCSGGSVSRSGGTQPDNNENAFSFRWTFPEARPGTVRSTSKGRSRWSRRLHYPSVVPPLFPPTSLSKHPPSSMTAARMATTTLQHRYRCCGTLPPAWARTPFFLHRRDGGWRCSSGRQWWQLLCRYGCLCLLPAIGIAVAGGLDDGHREGALAEVRESMVGCRNSAMARLIMPGAANSNATSRASHGGPALPQSNKAPAACAYA